MPTNSITTNTGGIFYNWRILSQYNRNLIEMSQKDARLLEPYNNTVINAHYIVKKYCYIKEKNLILSQTGLIT